MKTKKISALVILVQLVVSSCSTNEVAKVENGKLDYYDAVGVNSVIPVDKSHFIYQEFEKSTYFSSANRSGRVSTDNINKLELVSFTNMPGMKLLKMTMKEDESSSGIDGVDVIEELNVLYNEDLSEIAMSWIQDYAIDLENKVEVSNQYYIDGSKYLSVKVNTETTSVLNIERFDTNNSGRMEREMSWGDCMEMAIEACADDWQCAVLCGLVFTECVAAIAIACLF